MTLIFYGIVITLIGMGCFWLMGTIYGLFRTPKMYFPLSLAATMTISAVLGNLLLLGGGIALATWAFNNELQKRPDYQLWPNIIAGGVISTSCSIIIFYLYILLISDALT